MNTLEQSAHGDQVRSVRQPSLASGRAQRLSTVDVVIPCYNYSRFLPACVGSVLSQSGVEVRVLVIDDASTDQTPEVGQQLAASDRRVEFRRHQANKGHIATYNEGLLEWSIADYVVLISADDMLAPGSLSRAAQIMEADGNIGMVYGRVIQFENEIELPTTTARKFSHARFSGTEWLDVRCKSGHNVITSPEVVVRGSVQRAVGGYRPELPHTGDLEMWLRIAAVSDLAYVRRIPQAFYRVHRSNMTKSRNNLVDLRQRMAAFDAFFRHHRDLSNATVLQESASRALAREALWDVCRAYDRDQVTECRADELVEFALTIDSGATSLAEYRALERRKRLGPAVCNRTQVFAASALVQKVRRSIKKRSWKRRGI